MPTRLRIFLLTLLLTGCASAPPSGGLLGAYRMDDGQIVSIRRSVDNLLRFRIYDSGASGRLYPVAANRFVSGDGFSQREPETLEVRFQTDGMGTARRIQWNILGVPPQLGQRIGVEREVFINSSGDRLFGRLHLPDAPPPYPAVVLVHGSGDSAGTEWFYNSDFFVANGIAALTYDKRGSGNSEGSFTFNFHQLAADASAAVDYLATVEEIDAGRIGLSGYSQGAWVAPLAASLNQRIQFVIVNYGMIESPAEEARLEMRQLLEDANVSAQELEAGDELIRAAVDLVASRFEEGWPRFNELKKRHKNAAWTKHLDGTPVGQLMSWPKFLVRWMGAGRLPPGLDWYYDSNRLLQETDTPMVWLLAGNDRSAPNGQTIETLQSLIEAKKPYELIVFPNTDHGMLTYREDNGERVYLGYAADYFRTEVSALKRLSQ